MHRAQRVVRSSAKTPPQIIDNRQPKEIPEISRANPDLPLRTVLLIEVGDMDVAKVQLLVQEANKMYDGARGGIHYVLPVRHGRIGTDILFESEWERVVQETCEVRDGQIKLKEGVQECEVIRQQI